MCEGSIHVRYRLATDKERLVVMPLPGYSGMKGFYPFNDNLDSRLVCLLGDKEIVIKQVRFEAGLPEAIVKKWEGKRNVTATFRHRPYCDVIKFSDGLQVMLQNVTVGTRVDLGIPVPQRKPKGMKVVEASIVEALALPPDPKPEDEDAPSQPAEPAPEPVREPDPAAPAARR